MYNRLKRYISRQFFNKLPQLLKNVNPSLVGKLYYWMMPIKVICNNPSADYVFCINAAAFQKDIDELAKKKSLNFIIMEQYWFGIIMLTYFSHDKNFFNHFYGVEEEKKDSLKIPIQRASLCLDSFITLFEAKHGKISWFLLPSFNQGGVSLINHYAAKTHRKVLCFYYEHYTFPMHLQAVRNLLLHYKTVSPGGKILLWHKNIRNLLLETNFAKAENIVVSGPPRFNRWFDIINKPGSPKKYITLLSFPGTDYLAPFTYMDVILCFKKLASKYTNYNFTVKCKDESHVAESLRILNNNVGNITISCDIDMIDLLSQSKVIVGYNSLSFLEALLSQAHLIYPFWGDSRYDPYMLQIDPADPEVKNIINIAQSREHFHEVLDEKIQGSNYAGPTEERIKFLNKSIYFDPLNKSVDVFEKIFLEES